MMALGIGIGTQFTKAPAAASGDFEWTTFTEHASTRKVYVSAAGSDANDGLTELTPKLTIAAGGALIRDGYPDWLLLRRGDTFANQTLTSVSNKGGLDATNRLLVSAYGTGARPIVDCNGTSWSNSGAKSNIAFVSIEITILSRGGGEDYAGPGGFGGSNVLFEDVSVHDLASGFTFQDFGGSGRPTDYEFRRCQVYDIYATTGGGLGVYFTKCDGIVFEECVIDYCGWHAGAGATPFYHNTYFQNDCGPIIFKNCTSARSASEAVKARCGGYITGNLCLGNNHLTDFNNGINDAAYATIPAQFSDNVCLEPRLRNMADANSDSLGVSMSAVHNWRFHRNIIAGNSMVPPSKALTVRSWVISDAASPYGTRGVTDCEFHDNIVYKSHSVWRIGNGSGNPAYFNNNSFSGNVIHEPWNDSNLYGDRFVVISASNTFDASVTFDGNTYYSLWPAGEWFVITFVGYYSVSGFNTLVGDTTSVGADISGSYPNPDADIGDYLASIGETNANDAWTDIDTLLGLMRVNHKEGPWNDAHSAPAVRDWFRANFGLAPV